VVPYDSASVQQLREGSLEIVGGHGFANPRATAGTTLRPEHRPHPNLKVMLRRAPVNLGDAPASTQVFRAAVRQTPIAPGWASPLFRDQALGMMPRQARANFYTKSTPRLATAFAARPPSAVENGPPLHCRTPKPHGARSLQDTVAALSAELDLDTLLDRIVNEAARAFQAEAVSLMLWDQPATELVITASSGLSADYARRQRIPTRAGGRCHHRPTESRASLHARPGQYPFGDRELIATEGLCSVLAMPLVYQARLSGVLKHLQQRAGPAPSPLPRSSWPRLLPPRRQSPSKTPGYTRPT